MDITYIVILVLSLALQFLSLGFAIAWPRQRGKLLICIFVLLLISETAHWAIFNFFVQRDVIEIGSTTFTILRFTGIALGIANLAALLGFVITIFYASIPVIAEPAPFQEQRRSPTGIPVTQSVPVVPTIPVHAPIAFAQEALPRRQETSGLATGSLVLAVASFILLGPLTAIPAIVLALYARGRIRKSGGALAGDGLVTAAIVVAGISVFVWIASGLVMVPAMARAREAARRASSANHLKEMGIVCKLYSNENTTMEFPPISSTPGRLMMSASAIYPEYLADPSVLWSPGSEAPDIDESDPGDYWMKHIDDHHYIYLSHALPDEATGLAWAAAYREATAQGGDLNNDFYSTQGRIYRLREGVERNFVDDPNDPAAYARTQSALPVLMERPGFWAREGGNVLYVDGHVAFVEWGEFPYTSRFMEAIAELDALESKPAAETN